MSVNGLLLRVLVLCGAIIASGVNAQYPGHPGGHSTQELAYVFTYRQVAQASSIKGEIPITVPLTATPVELGEVIALPGDAGTLKLERILPLAAREQTIEVDEDGKSPPAIQISVDGPSQSMQAWLIADDPARDRLASLIAGWGYSAVTNMEERDRLFKQFENELTRPPTVWISRTDGSGAQQLSAQKGAKRDIPELGCRLEIKDFLVDFAMDKETKKRVSRSEKRLNPAVLVEIEASGEREERWVFSRFPDFKIGDGDRLPFEVRLDCPTDQENPLPSFLFVTVARKQHELWSRVAGKHSTTPMTPEQKIAVPGTEFTFRVARFVASGRLIEEFSPTDQPNAVTVLKVDYSDASGNHTGLWVEEGRPSTLQAASGAFVLELRRKGTSGHNHRPNLSQHDD